jgi:hypothetical protein
MMGFYTCDWRSLWPRCRFSAGAVLAALLILVLASAGPSAGYVTERVVLVIVDGLRYSEGLGDSNHTFIPNMYELSLRGAICEPFTNDYVTDTMHGVPAIWCGAWTDLQPFRDRQCGGAENYHCGPPTVFEYYRKQLDRPEEDCIYVLSDVGCAWKASLDPDYGADYWPLYHSVGTTDLEVWHEAEAVLTTYHPSFLLLYLARVDHFGHTGSWSYYTRSVEIADSIVGLLWEYLQSDSVYAGKTTMFVTNDHGRHSHDFTTHGCACTGCRTVQLLAVGPDIRPGLVSTTPRTLCDIVPTIGELMGFSAEKATGSAMLEILIDTKIETGTDAAVLPLE